MKISYENYLGSKGGAGVYQAIINLMPPHDCFIEAFLGTGVVMKKKAAAKRNIGLDLNQQCIDEFNYTAAELHCLDAFEFLKNFDYENNGTTVAYLDPPYRICTRTSHSKYEHELTDKQHLELIKICRSLPCFLLLSGYRNEMYDTLLNDWWSIDFQAMTRGGVRTETIWCNFEPGSIHYHSYAGTNFTDRQRIKRKAQRWAKNYKNLPEGEKQAILAAILST